MHSPHRRSSAADEPGMTSMIDVVFLLLVFFVWTSSFDQPELDLASQIAMPASSLEALEKNSDGAVARQTPPDRPPPRRPPPRREEIVVRIIATGGQLQYQVGAVAVPSLAQVSDKLKAIAGLRLDPIVIVDPDDDVPLADCVAVFDAALSVGLKRVLFAVE